MNPAFFSQQVFMSNWVWAYVLAYWTAKILGHNGSCHLVLLVARINDWLSSSVADSHAGYLLTHWLTFIFICSYSSIKHQATMRCPFSSRVSNKEAKMVGNSTKNSTVSCLSSCWFLCKVKSLWLLQNCAQPPIITHANVLVFIGQRNMLRWGKALEMLVKPLKMLCQQKLLSSSKRLGILGATVIDVTSCL